MTSKWGAEGDAGAAGKGGPGGGNSKRRGGAAGISWTPLRNSKEQEWLGQSTRGRAELGLKARGVRRWGGPGRALADTGAPAPRPQMVYWLDHSLPASLGLCLLRQLLSHFSCVQLCVTPWTVAPRLLHPWDSPGKNTGVGCHALLQGILPTQGWNPVSCIAGRFFTNEPPPGKPHLPAGTL